MALVCYCNSSINNSSCRCCEISSSLDLRQAEKDLTEILACPIGLFLFCCGCDYETETVTDRDRETDRQTLGTYPRAWVRRRRITQS